MREHRDTGWGRLARATLSSIKVRLTLVAVATLLGCIGATTYLLVAQAESDTLTLQRQRQLDESARTAAELSRRVVAVQRSLSAAAAQVTPTMLLDAARLSEHLAANTVLRGLFDSVFIAAPSGAVLAYVDGAGARETTLNLAARDYFVRTIAQDRPKISGPVFGAASSQPVIVFTYPLHGPNGVLGVVGGSIQLSSRNLLSDLVDAPEDPSETFTVITDAQGQILAHQNRNRLLQTLFSESRLAHAFAEWSANGSSVEPSGLLLHDPDFVLTGAGVPDADWMVWRGQSHIRLLAPLHQAQRRTLAWALWIAALGSLAILASTAYLLRPLTMLKRRAQHLFDAAHDVQRGWPHDDGEIGALARILRHVAAERAQLEQFNGDVLAKLGSVMAAAPVGILFTRDHRIELVSVELCRMIGKSESELLGQPARVLFASNEDYEALGPKVLDAFAQGHPYEGEWRFLRVGQPVFWGRMRGRPVDGANAAAGAIWTLDDITQHIAARERLEWQANHDALTGLANRKAFDKRVARVFEARPKSFPAAVVMIDLDHFKPINDKAGHAAGDAMLRVVAASITARVRASDLVARLGGDEFALLLERCPQDVALRIASNVQQSIAEIRLPWESDVLQVGASLGVASLNEQTPTIQAWLHDADTACYDAKAAGRGTVKAALPHRLRVVGSDTGDA